MNGSPPRPGFRSGRVPTNHGPVRQALRGRSYREHFINEAAEEGGIVPLPPARPALMGDERG